MGRELKNARDVDLPRSSRHDGEAFAVFYRRYERLVVRRLMGRTGRPDLAADLTTEVFCRGVPERPPLPRRPGAGRSVAHRDRSAPSAPSNAQKPPCERRLCIAGAGFEPATFEL
jgi:hypothetical protein